ncbi:WD_REPEATS_REGION domain-containing protein, partial [Haematococcus lacustris]
MRAAGPQEPNAVRIALSAGSADCVNHILDAVLSEKVTPGSYHAITRALPEVAEKYPTMCEAFLTGLPLLVLGEMEIPSTLAGQGVIVEAAASYTSYKEVWQQALALDK